MLVAGQAALLEEQFLPLGRVGLGGRIDELGRRRALGEQVVGDRVDLGVVLGPVFLARGCWSGRRTAASASRAGTRGDW